MDSYFYVVITDFQNKIFCLEKLATYVSVPFFIPRIAVTQKAMDQNKNEMSPMLISQAFSCPDFFTWTGPVLIQTKSTSRIETMLG